MHNSLNKKEYSELKKILWKGIVPVSSGGMEWNGMFWEQQLFRSARVKRVVVVVVVGRMKVDKVGEKEKPQSGELCDPESYEFYTTWNGSYWTIWSQEMETSDLHFRPIIMATV